MSVNHGIRTKTYTRLSGPLHTPGYLSNLYLATDARQIFWLRDCPRTARSAFEVVHTALRTLAQCGSLETLSKKVCKRCARPVFTFVGEFGRWYTSQPA